MLSNVLRLLSSKLEVVLVLLRDYSHASIMFWFSFAGLVDCDEGHFPFSSAVQGDERPPSQFVCAFGVEVGAQIVSNQCDCASWFAVMSGCSGTGGGLHVTVLGSLPNCCVQLVGNRALGGVDVVL